MNYEMEKAVCFTGHRVIKRDFDRKILKDTIENLIKEGYEVFLCGMALGFDTLCFKALNGLKNKYPHIKTVACVPCANQSETFGEKNKKVYENLLRSADEVVILYPEYNDYCMKERDRYMVDNSSVCVSYIYRSSGGTYYTTKYAVEKGKKIIYIK
ncbi:MAG: DUF1273 family protein [Clostridia bacterium]|nr:DUF1273 family protein [Clostridia bacterium]